MLSKNLLNTQPYFQNLQLSGESGSSLVHDPLPHHREKSLRTEVIFDFTSRAALGESSGYLQCLIELGCRARLG